MTRSIAITIKITVAYDTARIGGISITSSTDITRVEAGNNRRLGTFPCDSTPHNR